MISIYTTSKLAHQNSKLPAHSYILLTAFTSVNASSFFHTLPMESEVPFLGIIVVDFPSDENAF